LLISLAPFVDAASDAGMFARELSKNGGKELREESDLRFSLWAQAIQVGINTSMLGLGPGPHLEIPASIAAGRMGENGPGNIEHPEQSSAPNFEAHNTFLDLLTQGGLIAVLSFVWILGVSAFTAHKTRLAGLTTLIFGVSLFCTTGLVVRHPLFWFAVALCLVAEDSPVRTLIPQRRREARP
jgi:O-antigen ligase